jgi:hypothetical protein
MVKILITGYKHSGTTMLMQLLRRHPQVGWIEMEESYIEHDKPKEWIIMMAKKRVPNLKEKAWGEKIPWGDRDVDKNAKRVITFSKRWLKYFGSGARIIHILRHPYDVSSSGLPDGNIPKNALKQIMNTVPKYIDFINNNSRAATVIYEELVSNPKKHLSHIFDFCNLKSTEKILNSVVNTKLKFGKINASRAYAFKNENIKSEINYNKIIKMADKIL